MNETLTELVEERVNELAVASTQLDTPAAKRDGIARQTRDARENKLGFSKLSILIPAYNE